MFLLALAVTVVFPPSVRIRGVIKRGWFPVYVVSLFATYNVLGQHNGLSQLSASSVCAIVTHEITFCFAFVLVLTPPIPHPSSSYSLFGSAVIRTACMLVR